MRMGPDKNSLLSGVCASLTSEPCMEYLMRRSQNLCVVRAMFVCIVGDKK